MLLLLKSLGVLKIKLCYRGNFEPFPIESSLSNNLAVMNTIKVLDILHQFVCNMV